MLVEGLALAGDNAAEQLKKELDHLDKPISTARVLFPRGMDANEYALKVTPEAQSFAVLLNRTEKPPAIPAEPVAQVSGDEITIHENERRYRIRGLAKNLSHELLKVNLLVSRGDLFHVDTLDLYSARQRAASAGSRRADRERGLNAGCRRKAPCGRCHARRERGVFFMRAIVLRRGGLSCGGCKWASQADVRHFLPLG